MLSTCREFHVLEFQNEELADKRIYLIWKLAAKLMRRLLRAGHVSRLNCASNWYKSRLKAIETNSVSFEVSIGFSTVAKWTFLPLRLYSRFWQLELSANTIRITASWPTRWDHNSTDSQNESLTISSEDAPSTLACHVSVLSENLWSISDWTLFNSMYAIEILVLHSPCGKTSRHQRHRQNERHPNCESLEAISI